MTTAEKIELALIPLSGAVLGLMASGLPERLTLGNLLLWLSAVLLFQGLIRDFWLLKKGKNAAGKQGLPRKARCICLESTIGVTGIIAGTALLGSGVNRSVVMNDWWWPILVMVTMGIGFIVKDYVLEWGPMRIRRDRDHMNVIFSWKN